MDTGTIGNIGGLGVAPLGTKMSQRHVVSAARIDDIFCDLQKLDLIKMDIEGAEFVALRGGEMTLRRLKPTIIMEINVKALKEVSGETVAALVGYMRDPGFAPYDFRARQNGEDVEVSFSEIEDILASRSDIFDFIFKPKDTI